MSITPLKLVENGALHVVLTYNPRGRCPHEGYRLDASDLLTNTTLQQRENCWFEHKYTPLGAIPTIVIVELPPTPSKFHYIFNLRDLSRISAGLCLTSPEYFKTPELFVRVWRNEFIRVICDRLINEEGVVPLRTSGHLARDQQPVFNAPQAGQL
ncbi:unnamed protein product [Timema podura]|uniref:Dynein heavy chain 3 AAA+ lid domain-containing protein n=1 Tax=Timema podura TaxID=61482 RepID=A0ABN7NV26_TIMPD|nr:unnamed protein product [Timema podura]